MNAAHLLADRESGRRRYIHPHTNIKLCSHDRFSVNDGPRVSQYAALCSHAGTRTVLCCEHDGPSPCANVRIMAWRAGEEQSRTISVSNGRALDMDVSPCGRMIAHTRPDGVIIRDMESGENLHCMDYGAHEPKRVKFTSPHTVLVVGGCMGCTLWDARCGDHVLSVMMNSGCTPTCADADDDSHMMYIGSDKTSGCFAYDLRADRRHANAVAVSSGRGVLDIVANTTTVAVLWAGGVMDLRNRLLHPGEQFNIKVSQTSDKFRHRLRKMATNVACTSLGGVVIVLQSKHTQGLCIKFPGWKNTLPNAAWIGDDEIMCMNPSDGCHYIARVEETMS